VAGNKNPTIEGVGHYYTNKSGDIIRHPNAYKAAWGKPIYHASTKRIEVGDKWFSSNFTIKQFKIEKLKVFS